jgi:general secretion pathway protein E
LGRTGVFELMLADDATRQLIHQGAPESDIRAAALAGGMMPLRTDGERLVQQGLISAAELVRATRD